MSSVPQAKYRMLRDFATIPNCIVCFRAYISKYSNQTQLIFIVMTCEKFLIFLMEYAVSLVTYGIIRLRFQLIFFCLSSVSFHFEENCPLVLIVKFFSSIKDTFKQINNYFLFKFHIYYVTFG